MRRTATWLHSRIANFVLILGYHRVAETAVDPYDLCVQPGRFAEHLDVLHRETRVIDLEMLADGLQNGQLPRRAVAITFDDGYQDIFRTVKPLLAARDLPAAVFVVTGALGQEFWWDRLARIVFSPAVLPDRLTMPIGADTFTWPVMDTVQATGQKEVPSPRRRLLGQLYHRLAVLPEERPSILLRLQQWAETAAPVTPAASGAMTAVELQSLTGDGLITVGSHTVSHPALTALPQARQQTELTGSRQTLAEILGRPATTFSYPHGDNDAQTRRLVKQAGFQLAFSSQNGIVHVRQDRFALPRFWAPDWDGKRFGRWLARWIRN